MPIFNKKSKNYYGIDLLFVRLDPKFWIVENILSQKVLTQLNEKKI